jgi:fermentation-respiration switch protein FrsA (DUF1100 family)
MSVMMKSHPSPKPSGPTEEERQEAGRKRRIGNVFASIVLTPLCCYVAFTALLWLFQRELMYFPDRQPFYQMTGLQPKGMDTVTTVTADGLSLKAWFAPPKDKSSKIVVYFHGNGGNAAYVAGKAPYFLRRGYGYFLCEYRGYGGSPGSPTETGIYADARAALDWLKKQGYKPSQFVYYGESLGTGVAVQMASENAPAALILESPYTSTAAVAKLEFPFAPVDALMDDRYESDRKIGGIHAPLLILHGERDQLIPFAQGQALFALANEPKTFLPFPEGAHGTLYQLKAGDLIADWLDKTTGNKTPYDRSEKNP